MWKYESKKRTAYYDRAVKLYYEEHLGCRKIAQIFSLSKSTISNWIRNFATENPQNELVMKRQGKVTMQQELSSAEPQKATGSPATGLSESSDVTALQAEIKRLKKALAQESLRADVYDEMINVAEQQFGISIRKKAGTK